MNSAAAAALEGRGGPHYSSGIASLACRCQKAVARISPDGDQMLSANNATAPIPITRTTSAMGS
jgi:hypothetical protein